MSQFLAARIRTFLAENPETSATALAQSVGCSLGTARKYAKEMGITLTHGNQRTPREVPQGQQIGPMRAAIDEALRGPLVVSIIREIVNQWLATRAVTLTPTAEQVTEALHGPEGTEMIAKALRVQGYAGIYSALYRNHGEVVRMALHSPSENVQKRSSVEDLGNRFAAIMGDHRGDVMMNAFFAALGADGRRVFGDAVRKIVAGGEKTV